MKTRTLFAVMTALTLHVSPTLADEHAARGDIAAGEESYSAGCAHCHGRSGRGMGSFPRISGKSFDYLSDRLLTYRAGGSVGPNSALMIPNAADLSDDDIDNLSAYMASRFQ